MYGLLISAPGIIDAGKRYITPFRVAALSIDIARVWIFLAVRITRRFNDARSLAAWASSDPENVPLVQMEQELMEIAKRQCDEFFRLAGLFSTLLSYNGNSLLSALENSGIFIDRRDY